MRRLSFAALFAALALSGCSDGKLKVYPVSGQVLYNGQPLKGVDVAFHPADKAHDSGFPPTATTDADGKFALTTYLTGDGAPAGAYQVAVAFSAEQAGPDDGSDQARKLLFQVPVKYHKKETSGLTVTVKPEPNVLEPFKLEGPPLPARAKR